MSPIAPVAEAHSQFYGNGLCCSVTASCASGATCCQIASGVVEAAVEDAAVEDAEQLHLVGWVWRWWRWGCEVGGAVEEDVVVEVVATNQYILSITSISGLLIFVKFHLCH